jgi:hypothetical protein
LGCFVVACSSDTEKSFWERCASVRHIATILVASQAVLGCLEFKLFMDHSFEQDRFRVNNCCCKMFALMAVTGLLGESTRFTSCKLERRCFVASSFYQ